MVHTWRYATTDAVSARPAAEAMSHEGAEHCPALAIAMKLTMTRMLSRMLSRSSDGPGASAPVSAPRRDAVPPPRKRSRPPDDAEEADTPVDEDLIDTLMNKRGAPASMDKLKDNDNNQVVVFHHLGALAVQQMNATATQGGNRGREFILDTKTQTYVWLRTVDGSSNVDSKCMAYAKMKDAHARRVVKEHGRMAFASLRRTKLRRKVKLAVLIGRGQTRARSTRQVSPCGAASSS